MVGLSAVVVGLQLGPGGSVAGAAKACTPLLPDRLSPRSLQHFVAGLRIAVSLVLGGDCGASDVPSGSFASRSASTPDPASRLVGRGSLPSAKCLELVLLEDLVPGESFSV